MEYISIFWDFCSPPYRGDNETRFKDICLVHLIIHIGRTLTNHDASKRVVAVFCDMLKSFERVDYKI